MHVARSQIIDDAKLLSPQIDLCTVYYSACNRTVVSILCRRSTVLLRTHSSPISNCGVYFELPIPPPCSPLPPEVGSHHGLIIIRQAACYNDNHRTKLLFMFYEYFRTSAHTITLSFSIIVIRTQHQCVTTRGHIHQVTCIIIVLFRDMPWHMPWYLKYCSITLVNRRCASRNEPTYYYSNNYYY